MSDNTIIYQSVELNKLVYNFLQENQSWTSFKITSKQLIFA